MSMDKKDKTTFKQFIADSKKQLESVMDTSPLVETEYDVNSYCRLVIGESLEEKQTVVLKPGHMISVLWEYNQNNDPDPKNIRFLNVESLDSDHEFDLYWSKNQLTKWLCKNTKTSRTPNESRQT